MPIHIIDDDESIAEVVSDLVSAYSDQRRCFLSAEQYLLYMQSDDYIEPRLIITDVMLDGMNGFAFIKEIRKINTEVKIMVMSGYHHHHAIDSDFDAFIAKPFNVEALIATVSSLYQSAGRLVGKAAA